MSGLLSGLTDIPPVVDALVNLGKRFAIASHLRPQPRNDLSPPYPCQIFISPIFHSQYRLAILNAVRMEPCRVRAGR